MKEQSILQMARGVLLERADYEMAQIINNILDVNTDPTKKRTLTLKLEITPDAERQNLQFKCTAKSTLQPTNPVSFMLYVSSSELGNVKVVEYTPQIPGQMDLSGGEQEAPAALRLLDIGGN